MGRAGRELGDLTAELLRAGPSGRFLMLSLTESTTMSHLVSASSDTAIWIASSFIRRQNGLLAT